MNERNVEALAALLKEMAGGAGDGWYEEARWLIKRGGVLVPSALTPEECRGIRMAWLSPLSPSVDTPWAFVRAGLERIAKGEA